MPAQVAASRVVRPSAGSVALLAANANRKSARVYNNAPGAFLYIRIKGARPVCLAHGTFYEIPAGYTGEVEGAWMPLDRAEGSAGEALVLEIGEVT